MLQLSYAKETPAAVRAQVDQRLRAALTRRGCELVAAGHRAPPIGCTSGPCLAKLGRAFGAERLITGGVSATGNSYDLLFSVIDAPSGVTLAQVTRRCDVCTFAEVGSAVEQAVEQLVQRAQRVVATQGRIVIAPTRRGVEVWLDGVPLGKAPLERLVAPGRHRLELRAEGWRRRGQVNVYAGRRLLITNAIARRAAARRPAPPPPPGEVGLPAWLAAGAAVAVLAAGVVTLALDEGCPRGACEDRRETLAPGLALLGAGAALTVGAGLLIHYYRSEPARAAGRRSDKTSKTSGGLALGLGPTGASLLFRGRF